LQELHGVKILAAAKLIRVPLAIFS